MQTKSLCQKTLTVFYKSIEASNSRSMPLAQEAQITDLNTLVRGHKSQIKLGSKSLQNYLCNASGVSVGCS